MSVIMAKKRIKAKAQIAKEKAKKAGGKQPTAAQVKAAEKLGIEFDPATITADALKVLVDDAKVKAKEAKAAEKAKKKPAKKKTAKKKKAKAKK